MKIQLKLGDDPNRPRRRKKFLWAPKCLDGVVRWLEFAEWEEAFVACYTDGVWQATRWLDIPPPEVRPDDPVKEIIVAAAIKERNGTFYGTRHGAIIRQMVSCHNYTKVVGEQGFLTSAGRFLNREDAAKLAIASGQIKELKFSQRDLFSEDLW